MQGLATVTRDISERKKMEAALRASESRYRLLAELSPQALWTADREGRVLYANRRFLDYAGKQSLPHDPQEYINLFHKEDREGSLAAWMHSVKTGEDFAIDVRLVRALTAPRAGGICARFLCATKPAQSNAGLAWAMMCMRPDG